MAEILGEIFKVIFELILQIIIYIIIQLIAHLIVVPLFEYFFGRTRWFSVLYIALAGFVGYQLYRSLLIAENPSASFYSVLATIIVLMIAPLIHGRIAPLLTKILRPEQ